MPKYEAELHYIVSYATTILIDAEDEEEANLKAESWLEDSNPITEEWDYSECDASVYCVNEIVEAK